MVELAKNTTDTTNVELGDNISFGENDADRMQGSLTFPSLKIDTESFLPQQVDDHNCGMAVIAATGIILRDLFGQPGFTLKFHSLISVVNLEVLQEERYRKSNKYVEWYCVLPMSTFREVADQTLGTYLERLKVDFMCCLTDSLSLSMNPFQDQLTKMQRSSFFARAARNASDGQPT